MDADVTASIFRVKVRGASMKKLAHTSSMQGRLSLCLHPLLSTLKMEQEGSSVFLQNTSFWVQAALCHNPADQNLNTPCHENLTLLVNDMCLIARKGCSDGLWSCKGWGKLMYSCHCLPTSGTVFQKDLV